MGEVAGPYRRRTDADTDVDLDPNLVVAEVRGGPLFAVARRLDALVSVSSSPIQILRLSRSAAWPALPTAMTTRPQFASSAASAVFTSGEFAIDDAIDLGPQSSRRPTRTLRRTW